LSITDQIDLLAIGFIVVLASVSARRGIILSAYDFVTGVAVLVAAGNLFRLVGVLVAEQLQLSVSDSTLYSFLLILFVGELIRLRVGALFSNTNLALSDNPGFSDLVDTLGAILFGLLRATYFIALVIVLINAVPAVASWREPIARASVTHAIQSIYSILLPPGVVPTDYSSASASGASGLPLPVSGEPLPTSVGNPGRPDPGAESQLLDMTNLARQQAGLPPFVVVPELSIIASEHTTEMSKLALLFHESPTSGSISDRLRTAGISYRRNAENVAYARAVEFAFAGLMLSSDHRSNILSPDLHRIGVAVSQTDPSGFLLTQDFAD
jgi:uncharacterized protein YkwD